jgi:hypothetical protein
MLEPIVLHLAEPLEIFGISVPVPRPEESHRIFGTFFLVFGVILGFETLAGGVWHRQRWRTLIWPAGLLLLGAGGLMVAVLDPKDRFVHASMGALLLIAAYVEGRYRLGQLTRSQADLWLIPALLVAAFEAGVIHAHGEADVVIAHVIVGLTGVALAAARAYQSLQPTSMLRSALICVLIMFLGLQFLGHPTAPHPLDNTQGSLAAETGN